MPELIWLYHGTATRETSGTVSLSNPRRLSWWRPQAIFSREMLTRVEERSNPPARRSCVNRLRGIS
jgi:hypothetical protein